TIMDGRRIYAPELVDLAYRQPENPLTEREKQVIELMAVGKDTKEISSKLSITTGTVRNYISVILDKLEVSNRIEAISRFKEKGWFKEYTSVLYAFTIRRPRLLDEQWALLRFNSLTSH